MSAAKPAPQKPPRLVLRFAIYTALALLLAGLAIFWFVRHETQENAELERVARAVRIATRTAVEVQPADLKGPVSPRRAAELDRAFSDESSGDLVLVRLWTTNGVLAYSSEHRLIGSRSTEVEKLEAALGGGTLKEVVDTADEGSRMSRKTLEALVPVLSDGRPAATLELNFDYAPVASYVRATMTPIAIALVFALLLLYTTLLPILRQVTRTLEARTRRMSEHADELQRALEEREQVEEKLSAAERGYRNLIEQLPLVTYIDHVDDSSSSIYISPQAEALFGYPPVAWLSDPEFFPKVLHPADRERVLAQHREAYASGDSFSSEYRVLARDGRVVWVQDHVMIARDDAGRPLHAQGFMLDVTERKQAEENLRLQNQELAALHETALGLIERLDPDSLLEAILERACELTGTPHAYLYLEDGDELEVRLARGRFAQRLGYRLARGEGLAGTVWETGEPLAVEDYRTWSGRRTDFDGEPLHAIVGVPLRSGGKVVGVLGLARDEAARPFTVPEVTFLRRIGHLASVALENARLYSALAESEEHFRALVANVPGAIFLCAFDADWTMEFLSDAIEEIAGYPAAELIHNRVRSYASIVHPDDADMLTEAVGDGAPYSVEYRVVRPDGTVRWVLERGQGVHDAAGNAWLAGAVFDVTERRIAEQERVQLAAIVESSEDAIISTDLDDVVVSWNAGAEHIYGYTAEEAVGRPISIIVPPDRSHERPRWLREIRAGKSIENRDSVRLRKDGEPVDVALTLSPIHDASGAMIGASTIARDVTKRRRAEQALAASEAKFRAFVETTDEWVWEIDAEAVMTYSNPGVERILGYSPEELVGRNSLELVYEEDRARVEAELRRSAARKDGWSGLILRWLTSDGSVRHLESNGTPILDAEGTLRGWRGTDRDVTARVLAEAEREALLADLADQNERLLELDRLKDEFIALVSHELRTPLTSIRGYTELLIDETAGRLTDEQRQFLAVVDRNSNRLLNLVGDLLFLAQIEAGKLVLDVGALDLGSLASEAVETARPAAEEKGVTLTLATGPVPLLAGDRSRIGQLLDNLVSNAVKFTGAGGRVDVRVRSLKKRAVLEVRDSGIGIPAAEQQFLFERFFRTSTATEQAIQGTGLGLAISKAIVEAHGGEISVESKEGVGTTFRVTLPLQQHAHQPRSEAVAL
jgi:PAS domain S-box-containing protein